mgnify:CR=1 FL=1
MNTAYTRTAKTLHWLMAALLFGLLALGFYMRDLPLSPDKLQLYSWHKWAGVSVFLLNIGFVLVLAGHIGAALKHHFIDKDDILKRMLPSHQAPRRTS